MTDVLRMHIGDRDPVAALLVKVNDILTFLGGSGLRSIATLAVDVVPEKFKTTTTSVIQIGGVLYAKAAETAIAFSAAHQITALKHGAVRVQRNAAGTVSTKVVASPQAYDSAALAIAALPDADAGNVSLGYILIEAGAADWDAQTDDMTAASDLTAVTFVDEDVLELPESFTVNGATPV